jgi:hypothetical protein
LTETEYATARTVAIEIGQAPESGHMQLAAEGPNSVIDEVLLRAPKILPLGGAAHQSLCSRALVGMRQLRRSSGPPQPMQDDEDISP